MKRALILAVCLVFASTMAFAQAGSIGLFSDPGGASCDVYDVPAVVYVYVIHVLTPGATGSQFRVNDADWGNAMVFLAETVTLPYLKIGQCRDGCAIAYGSCIAGPNMILTLMYSGTALTPPCSYIQVVADPTTEDPPPGIWVTDCVIPPNLIPATGGDVVINPDETCMCNIPVQDTNWGRIKSLYR
ncbi:MAG: hypothetical protein GTO51_09820 [Candidatus Latescibacteria bacterium]|nr:hypothetical protein [Candidatus Latescibacterota bacterium]NIM22226.1 hypothetical protein [Candidatus Latescibacterota bacterium]NIM66265.1 hypothetical protein [Candidatus Latescibacterota bacterium]NIO02342.1 hypothetical protein [Candidatus Latescibacterota bacterium]NIO29873.1 hypothetical protein [Candidatus Latescibacterota bacterium]